MQRCPGRIILQLRLPRLPRPDYELPLSEMQNSLKVPCSPCRAELYVSLCWLRRGTHANELYRYKARPIKRYMDDVAGAASCSEEDLRQFLVFAFSFYPNLDYTWSVSTNKLPFLDIYMKPRDNRISISI